MGTAAGRTEADGQEERAMAGREGEGQTVPGRGRGTGKGPGWGKAGLEFANGMGWLLSAGRREGGEGVGGIEAAHTGLQGPQGVFGALPDQRGDRRWGQRNSFTGEPQDTGGSPASSHAQHPVWVGLLRRNRNDEEALALRECVSASVLSTFLCSLFGSL